MIACPAPRSACPARSDLRGNLREEPRSAYSEQLLRSAHRLTPAPVAFASSQILLPLSVSRRLCGNLNLFALCFHGLTNCFSRNPFLFTIICVAPGVGVTNSPILPLFPLWLGVSVANPIPSRVWGLFNSLAVFFRTPILCFQSFAHSSTKTPGVGGV